MDSYYIEILIKRMINYVRLSDIKKISDNVYYQTFDKWTSISKIPKSDDPKNILSKNKHKINNMISTYGSDYDKIYHLICDMIVNDKLDSDSIYNIFCELVKYWYHEVLDKLYNSQLPISIVDKDYTLLHLLSFPYVLPANFIRSNEDLIKTYDFITKMDITPLDVNKYNETCFHSLKYAYTNNKINSEQFEIIRKKILYPEPRIIHLINMSLLKKIYNIQVNIINDDEINVNDFVIWSCILDPKLFMEDMYVFDKEAKSENNGIETHMFDAIYQILKNGPTKNIDQKIPYIDDFIAEMIKECKNNNLSPQTVILQKFGGS